jgi:hypothetical protein
MTPYRKLFSETSRVERLAYFYKDGEEKNKKQISELEKELMDDGILDNNNGVPGEFLSKNDFDRFHRITKHLPEYK